MAWYTVSLIPAMPAVVLALSLGTARYHFDLDRHTAGRARNPAHELDGNAHGLASRTAITTPMITAPGQRDACLRASSASARSLFPAAQLPGWLAEVNLWLPFGSMATIVRASWRAGWRAGCPRLPGGGGVGGVGPHGSSWRGLQGRRLD